MKSQIAPPKTMVPKEDLAEFKLRFERILDARESAQEFMRCEDTLARCDDARAVAAEGMRRSRRAYLDCCRDFVWMQDSKAWQDAYLTWPEFCEATDFRTDCVNRMMRGARALDGLSPAAQKAMEGISGRQLQILSLSEPEACEAAAQEILETGDVGAAFGNLRKKLDDEAPEEELDEAEAPERPKAEKDLSWFKKWATSARQYFEVRGILDDETKAHLAALLAKATMAANESIVG